MTNPDAVLLTDVTYMDAIQRQLGVMDATAITMCMDNDIPIRVFNLAKPGNIAAAVRGTGVHAVMGIGGAPEGVLTAAAMRCLGGEIQVRLTPLDKGQVERAHKLSITDFDQIYHTDDLAPGKEILFSATGVTDGQLLRGVRFFGGGHRTSTLLMSLPFGSSTPASTVAMDVVSKPPMKIGR